MLNAPLVPLTILSECAKENLHIIYYIYQPETKAVC